MSLDTLPSEVLNLIIYHLRNISPPKSDKQPRNQDLSRYAAISRNWKAAVEQYTFTAVKTSSSDLAHFKKIINPRRRKFVQTLFYQIDLPVYSESRSRCFERRPEHEANLVTFRAGIRELWKELALWSDGDNPSAGLRLVLTADAPVNYPGGLGDARWAYPEHSLTLNDSDNASGNTALPDIPRIASFHVANTGRRIHPSAIGTILASLPNIRDLELKIYPIQPKHQALVTEHITALAHALESPTLGRLERLRIWLGQHAPRDHNHPSDTAVSRDPSYPDGDVLNKVVSKLAQQSLRELYLDEAWMISPALFMATDTENSDDLTFPYLKTVAISFPLITYDGRWLYTGDPDDIPRAPLEGTPPRPPKPELEPEAEPDSDSNSEPGDGIDIDDYNGSILNGDEPGHPWRIIPDSETFDPIVRSLAAAVLEMPSLEHLKVETTPTAADLEYYEIAFEFLRPGLVADTVPIQDQTNAHCGKWRWIVSLGIEASWLLPEDIRELMERRPVAANCSSAKRQSQPATPKVLVENAQNNSSLDDPYLNLPVIGTGMTGTIYDLGNGRVVKKAKQSHLRDPGDAEYMNEINRKTLENEAQIFQRLDGGQGTIPCFQVSPHGIELARAEDDLESYLETHPEREDSFKIRWMLSLIEALAYTHSCKVFVDDLALRNILVLEGQLKVADFGQSILLPLDADIASACEDDPMFALRSSILAGCSTRLLRGGSTNTISLVRRTLALSGPLCSQTLVMFFGARLLRNAGVASMRAWLS
ncbi:uncharacterized protein DSM5745_01763 [Aspergillus mulundensis]|uniref:Protein kinase domain-containing protein n=1 Tax=Aspergillus mulundensis TaxID=1810919 RepID=A0A3D8SW15_9EURO|nr:hypothetical protein DSM5745_01763 [Aspergillus mulundensis]RDW89988.1 hypothetical protein DSM5745_01763 [Aspergillus mulundensis]